MQLADKQFGRTLQKSGGVCVRGEGGLEKKNTKEDAQPPPPPLRSCSDPSSPLQASPSLRGCLISGVYRTSITSL